MEIKEKPIFTDISFPKLLNLMTVTTVRIIKIGARSRCPSVYAMARRPHGRASFFSLSPYNLCHNIYLPCPDSTDEPDLPPAQGPAGRNQEHERSFSIDFFSSV